MKIDINNSDFLRCYRFFDAKFRRLSIFGKFSKGKLTIWVLTTSHKDMFSKKEAKKLFSEYVGYREGDEQPAISPEIFTIPSSSEKYKRDFVDFCRKNYLTMQTFELVLMDKIIRVDCYVNNYIGGKAIVDTSSLRIKQLSKEQLNAYIRVAKKQEVTRNIMPNSTDEFEEFFRGDNKNPLQN